MTNKSAPPVSTLDFDYEAYQSHNALVHAYGPTAHFMDRIVRQVGAPLMGLRILDLGCGTGHFSLLLEDRNRVVSYDPAYEGVAITRRRRKTAGGAMVGSGEQLPFRDGSFDGVLLIDVLEHIADDRQVAREVARVVRPGGYVLCMVPENQRLYSRIDAANGHLRRYSREQLLDIFAPCVPEMLFDYGFPFMRLYLRVLAQTHDTVVPAAPPTGLRRLGLRLLSRALTTLFTVDLLFAGWFRGVELVALFRTPSPSPR